MVVFTDQFSTYMGKNYKRFKYIDVYIYKEFLQHTEKNYKHFKHIDV